MQTHLGTRDARLPRPTPSMPLTAPQVRLGLWESQGQWACPAYPGCEPGLPPASANEWRGHCQQATWAWGGGSGLGSQERGHLSALGPLKATGKAKRHSSKPRPRSVPTRAGKAGARVDQAGIGGWAAGR